MKLVWTNSIGAEIDSKVVPEPTDADRERGIRDKSEKAVDVLFAMVGDCATLNPGDTIRVVGHG